jgi:glycosyltransferase involved in cell wall biosynthesis
MPCDFVVIARRPSRWPSMRIVLDLGTSWAWTRPPVGIVRTERKFAQHLLESGDIPVAFCRFDKTLGCHVAIDTARARELVGLVSYVPKNEVPDDAGAAPVETANPVASTAVVTTAATEASAGPEKVSMRVRAAAAAKRMGHAFVHRMPESLRPEALDALRAGKTFTMGSARVAARWMRIAKERRSHAAAFPTSGTLLSPPTAEAFVFEPTDVYLSMGLDWEYNDLVVLQRERRRLGFKTVLFCYDTIPVKFPHLMSFDARQMFARYFVDVAHVADRVVAISETSRGDFLALMDEVGAPKPPVDVILLGTDLNVEESSERSPLAGLENTPFVLCVSTIEARKNHEVLYNAWDRLVAKHGDAFPQLVIVGMIGWGVGDLLFRMRINPRVKNRICILDNLPDAELAWLYRHSLFSVFPSLYEGWGLPVVESLALGKPCICSTAPAVTEAAQGLATALDPLDTPAWIAAIERLWQDAEARGKAAMRCVREFQPQTWEHHAEQLLRAAQETARP